MTVKHSKVRLQMIIRSFFQITAKAFQTRQSTFTLLKTIVFVVLQLLNDMTEMIDLFFFFNNCFQISDSFRYV